VAEAVKSGIEASKGTVTIYQYVAISPLGLWHQLTFDAPIRIPETLPEAVLQKMYAPPKPDYPIITPENLKDFDAFMFGIPTRYGNFPAQWKVSGVLAFDIQTHRADFRVQKAFWDATGKLWAEGALAGKFAGVFVTTGTPGGGQEATVMNSISTLTHHGIVFVPLGYTTAFAQLTNLTEPHGGKFFL
jgi:NAD(P)H dehydrogenase (quinone)